VFQAWCDEYFLLRHRGETLGVGHFFELPGPFRILYKVSIPKLRPQALSGAPPAASTQSCGAVFQLPAPAATGFCQLTRDLSRKRKPAATASANPVQPATAAAVMGKLISSSIGGTSSLCSTNGDRIVLMSLPPLALEYGYTPEASSASLAHRSFTCPRTGLQTNPLKIAPKPHRLLASRGLNGACWQPARF